MADHIASELLEDLPAVLGDLIGAIGRGVADAQYALDAAAIEQLTAIAKADGTVAEVLRLIGYQPTWYRIPELEADITMSLTLAARTEQSGRTSVQMYATPIDASFSNKYFVNAQVASNIKFKVVPVPPSPLASELTVVPILKQLTWIEAKTSLDALGIAYERRLLVSPSSQAADVIENADSDVVSETLPEEHSIIRPGDTLIVFTKKPDLDIR